MYQKIKIDTNGHDELQWLYSQDWDIIQDFCDA